MAEVLEVHTEENEEYKLDIQSVTHTVKPMIVFEYLCGTFRFSAIDKEIILPNGIMKAWSVIATGLVIIFAFLSLPSDIMSIISYLLIVINYVTCAIKTTFLDGEIHIRIFTMFAELDKMLSINYNTTFYMSYKIRTIVYLIILCIIHITLTSYSLVTDHNISVTKVITGQLYFLQKLEVLMFFLMIDMLKNRLNLINKYLAKFIEENEHEEFVFTVTRARRESNESYDWIGRPSNENIKMHDLALAYDHAVTICGLINDVFNFQILMTVITTFECIVVTIWRIINMYLSGVTDVESIATIALHNIVTIMNILIMSFVCGKLLDTREKMKILVNKVVMNYDLPKIMRNQAKAFMQLIQVCPLSISVYEMFSVDVSLILKFISIATTYLIVVIQISHTI